jgi:HK97 family phage major capsid protein
MQPNSINGEVLNILAKQLQELHGFTTQTQLDLAVADVVKRTGERLSRGPSFSLSTMVRGMMALHRTPITSATAESDASYVKALTTGGTPGSYLVGTQQANEIIAALLAGGTARQMGVRIWDMAGVQKLNVPTALAAPQWVWMAQNSVQQATDPSLGQMAFDLKERRALVAVPNQLIAVSQPAFDTLLSDLIGQGAAEHEDTAFFNTTTVSGGFTALQAASSISTLNTGGSANGGNLAYSDLLAVLAKAAAVKAKPPFVWAMSPRTFYQRALGMIDTTSRPICLPTMTTGLAGAVPYMLLGYPVFVTPFLTEDQTLGSGSSQATVVFMNPRYAHLAQDTGIELMISTERFFDANVTALRAVQHIDSGFSPAAGIICLKGVN